MLDEGRRASRHALQAVAGHEHGHVEDRAGVNGELRRTFAAGDDRRDAALDGDDAHLVDLEARVADLMENFSPAVISKVSPTSMVLVLPTCVRAASPTTTIRDQLLLSGRRRAA